MYLVTIHVPIFVAGEERLLASDWKRSLELLRDSIARTFGELVVVAPSLPADVNVSAQQLEKTTAEHDGIRLVPSFDLRCRCRDYWLTMRRRWLADIESIAAKADVVHAGLEDLYRPIAYAGLQVAWRLGATTVFVQDTDIALQKRQLARREPLPKRMEAAAYGAIYDRCCRRATRRADLSLLKGDHLMRRYGGGAKNAKEFHDTSYARADVASTAAIEERLASLEAARPLRLVYCGRFEPRKGVDHSVAILAKAVAQGANVALDLIGDGIERAKLERQVGDLNLADRVRFRGALPYGGELLARLAEYDALLFTPLAEDTPRMIFDGYAAGLPLVAYDIEYVRERAAAERAAVLLPSGDIESAAGIIANLDRNRQQLHPLTMAARQAADYHAAENWYRRRAEWTIEAHERRRQMSMHGLQSAIPADRGLQGSSR